MTVAVIRIVEEIGMDDNNALGVVRGNPETSARLGYDFRACIVGNTLTGLLLQTREVAGLDVDFGNLNACRDAVNERVMAYTQNALMVTGNPVYPGHCWRNGGWAPCPQVYSFVVHYRNIDGTPGAPYGPDMGFLNGLQLKTRFLGVIQTP